jgi:hypothetical protein
MNKLTVFLNLVCAGIFAEIADVAEIKKELGNHREEYYYLMHVRGNDFFLQNITIDMPESD